MLTKPLKCGMCIQDIIRNNYTDNADEIQNVIIIYNKELQHIHIEDQEYLFEGEDQDYVQKMFQKDKTKSYQLSLGHSDVCPNRKYRVLWQNENPLMTFNNP